MGLSTRKTELQSAMISLVDIYILLIFIRFLSMNYVLYLVSRLIYNAILMIRTYLQVSTINIRIQYIEELRVDPVEQSYLDVVDS